MKLSKTPFKTSKTRGTDEFKSIELMFQTGQLKRHSAGVYGFGQFLTRSLNKTIDLARRYLDKYDCIEVSLPLLQAKSVWAQSGRWDKYKASDTTFYCKGRDGEYFFSPTAEEFMSDIVKPHINSYKDLDCNVYQIGKKYRDEIRVRGGLTRSKEFIMHDGYSFASTKEGMEAEYAKMRKCYLELFKAMGIDALPVQAVNEYGGKISEEIMCFSHMGGDKVLYDEKTGFTCNVEVFDHPELMAMFKEQYGAIDRKRMVEKQAIEVGHIFMLDQFYSKSMDITFTNKEGKNEYCWMGTYGFGVGRVLNIALEHNCDDDGLVFPLAVAPYSIGIVSLCEDEQYKKAQNVYDYFNSNNVDVVWDDRDLSLGVKIKDMLLHGIPYIVVIGKNSKGDLLEVENRKTREKSFINKQALLKIIKQ